MYFMRLLGQLCLLLTYIGHTVRAYTPPWIYNGSTPDLEAIVKGRCYTYKILDLDNRDPELHISANCDTFWDTFSNAFKNKDPCKTNFMYAYNETLKLIDNGKSITNKAMFWSGTKEVVHDFTHVNSDYRTLEDTFSGYFADDLNWCGCKNCAGGIDFNFCNKSCSAIDQFWTDTSRQFAEKANGTAYVMVNGTASGNYTAYWNGSHFGKTELPTMGKLKKVKVLNIYVVNTLDKTPKEGCGTGTLVQLVNDAIKWGIPKTNCYDDPLMVQDILCAKYPNANECQPLKSGEVDRSWKDATIALIAVASVLLLTVIILLVMYNRRQINSDFDYQQNVET